MLSKIKSAVAIAETRSASLSHQANINNNNNNNNNLASDNEDETIDNDTNNNNNNNNLNNNQQTKKTEDELLDIVEVSRKRRLSRDSADSLGNFIKWSFSHIDHQHNFDSHSNFKVLEHNGKREKIHTLEEDIHLDEEDDWTTFSQLYRHHASGKLAEVDSDGGGGGSSATNLALIKNDRHLSSPSALLMDAASGRLNKRPRVYSPDSKFASSQLVGTSAGNRKSSSYLGNVVERLHQQQIQQQQQQQQQQNNQQQQQDLVQQDALHQAADSGASNAGLSFHLQQFLQQQTSLEDLCSSVGLDDSNQLVLAAAIHRALVDSMGPNQQAEAKSTASSTGSSSGGSSSGNNNNNLSTQSNANLNSLSNNSSGANLHLIDSLTRQRRAYNTRAALHGSGLSTGSPVGTQRIVSQQSHSNRGAQQQQQQVAANLSNRVQQQRHAQAAAALSALASAGAHNNNPITGSGNSNNQLTSSGTPMVDFECDTCGSSFDDRHRLMQHQSIHLELKKDWFTETPVDEVMKIFNRRRGEFLCNTCNLRFEATFDYDKHNHSVHGQRPYCCQFCGNGTRTFRFWRQYLNHLYDHRYIFSCTIDDCDFTVNRRDSLRFHIFRFHLNCQLPQNQHQSLRSVHNTMLLNDSKWPQIEDDEDGGDEMNVGE